MLPICYPNDSLPWCHQITPWCPTSSLMLPPVHPWCPQFTSDSPSSPLIPQVRPWCPEFAPDSPSSPLMPPVHPGHLQFVHDAPSLSPIPSVPLELVLSKLLVLFYLPNHSTNRNKFYLKQVQVQSTKSRHKSSRSLRSTSMQISSF